MKELKENFWKIKHDFTKHPKSYKSFAFFETKDEKYAILYSKIDEYGMLKTRSPVEIWTNKDKPRRLYKNEAIKFEFQGNRSCYYGEKSNLIILLIPCMDKFFLLSYCILDLTNSKFAKYYAPDHDLTELDAGIFRLDLHYRYFHDEAYKKKIEIKSGTIINIETLEWHPLTDLIQFCKYEIKIY